MTWGLIQDLKIKTKKEIPTGERILQTSEKGKENWEKGFSSGTIPEGVRLPIAPKSHQIQATGMS